MEDTPAEQAKLPNDQVANGLLDALDEEAAKLGPPLSADQAASRQALFAALLTAQAQTYALLYVGDQVKALVELHRDAFTQGTRVVGDLVPQLAKLLAPVRVEVVPPRLSDVDPALFGYVPHRVDIDPTAQHMPTVEYTRELLERYSRRQHGEHLGTDRCVCDPMCRAITEATR